MGVTQCHDTATPSKRQLEVWHPPVWRHLPTWRGNLKSDAPFHWGFRSWKGRTWGRVSVWVHRGRSDRAANANANSDAPREFASNFVLPPHFKRKTVNKVVRGNLLAFANAFVNEIAENPCEWMSFATKFTSDCECDGVVHLGECRPDWGLLGWDCSGRDSWECCSWTDPWDAIHSGYHGRWVMKRESSGGWEQLFWGTL